MYQAVLPNGMIYSVPFNGQPIQGPPMQHMVLHGVDYGQHQHLLHGATHIHLTGGAVPQPQLTGVEKTIEDATALLPSCLALLLNSKYTVGVSPRPPPPPLAALAPHPVSHPLATGTAPALAPNRHRAMCRPQIAAHEAGPPTGGGGPREEGQARRVPPAAPPLHAGAPLPPPLLKV